MIFIVRLFSEITIKSPPVRKRWSKKLVDNLKILTQRIDDRVRVVLDWDRLMVKVPDDTPGLDAQISAVLANTPGIANFSMATEHSYSSVHDIYELALSYWQDKLDDLTFCVRVKRTGKQDFTSIEVEKYVGGGLNQNTGALGVKLKNPDVTVLIEVKDELCYIVEKKTEGLGGFPIGTQESVLSLVSGGFDSTIASYMMMRRGLKTHFCFFNLGGQEHEVAVKEIAFYLWSKYGASHRVRFISVPFEEVVSEILQKIGPSNMGVVLKRMMIRASEKICERGDYEALVTGEAISQVSSQTLPNLQAINALSKTLVLRPLIAMDKPEIISVARKIGTEDFSANVPEYCGVISVKPSAKVNLGKLEKEEQHFDMAILDRAVESARAELIDEVPNSMQKRSEAVEQLAEPSPEHVIIDIRHPNEIDIKPLRLQQNNVLTIPFYTLSTRFAELASDTSYLLYCDKGVMSQLHAAHLRDSGFTNVAVYRP